MTIDKQYREQLARLYRLQSRGVKLGLERMRAALLLRGSPERELRCVHVAGTNGKGSVAAMIESGLRAAGHKTGLFTSPHLHEFGERIRVNGKNLSHSQITERLRDLLDFFERPDAPELSFFELTTLLAFEVFRDQRCEIVVLEIGLGGRMDSTNVAPSMLSVITRIALDHTNVLGTTHAAIAKEKAGILRPKVPLVCGVREPSALRAITELARKSQVPRFQIDHDFKITSNDPKSLAVDVRGHRYDKLLTKLAGAHQQDNVACAVAALHVLNTLGVGLADTAIRGGLASVKWPARLERIAGKPVIWLDAAHNPDGCNALAAHLTTLSERPRVLVFGAMQDKDVAAMLAPLLAVTEHRVFTTVSMPRAADPEVLAETYKGESQGTVAVALRHAKKLAGAKGCVIIAGSIFVVAEARATLLKLEADPLIRM